MFFSFFILLLLYFRSSIIYVESFIISYNKPFNYSYNKILNHNLNVNKSLIPNRTHFILKSSLSENSKQSTPSYYNSEHYKRLSKYFNSEEKLVEDTEYSKLKEKHVIPVEGTEFFTPSSYTIDSLLSVPELFHENFLIRGENHWDKLMQIRQKYQKRKEILDKIKQLHRDKSKSAYLYFSNQNKDTELRESNISIRNQIKDLNKEIDNIYSEINQLKNQLPNLLSREVSTENIVIKDCPENLKKNNKLPHYEILERLSGNYIDRAVSISGRGFSAYSGGVARLSRALVNFMLDTLTRVFNYKEINVPLIVSKSTLESTAHLPRFEEHLFKLDKCNLFNGETGYLIPTSEVPLVALNRNLRVKPKNLPLWFTGYSECFRSEIQDYGLETRGIIRQHQFGKVELICLSEAGNSEYIHQLMLSHIEFLLNSLGLPYRQVLLSAKDTGNTSSKTIDFEVYFPSLGHFVEVSSCSNTRDYQTNNLNLKTTTEKNIHCINGSGLAIGRTLSAILENNCVQKENGLLQINIPKPLQPYLNNDVAIYEEVTAY